jgi:D-arabinose 1-dehydrogenase-like Zn-dependent alcohol dehydrogenase
LKAVVLREYGGPENLRLEDLPRPAPAAEDVLVRVEACGVCHLDVIVRSGMRSRATLPLVLGHEIAGEVVDAGAAVTGFGQGDRVASITYQACGTCRCCRTGRPSLCREPRGDIGQVRPGGYAEYVSLPQSNLVRVPDGLPADAAALAACCLAPPYKAIRRVARVRPGETVLVTGATGGLGTAAVQIARAAAARTIAVTGSPAKAEPLRRLGADAVVVSPDGKFGDEVRRLTDGLGADVVVDTVGSGAFAGALRGLGRGGRYVVLGELSGTPVEVNLALVILKEWEVYGVQSASREDLEEVMQFLLRSGLRPAVWKTLPLDAVPDAHRQLGERRAVGRMVLVP